MNVRNRPEQAPRITIVDNDEDGRLLLERTLTRKFPRAAVHHCEDASAAVTQIQKGLVDLVIAHRTFGLSGVEVVRLLRQASGTVPIIMVSGLEKEREAKEAGASRFLHYDAWLQIGPLVEEVLRNPTPTSCFPHGDKECTESLDT